MGLILACERYCVGFSGRLQRELIQLVFLLHFLLLACFRHDGGAPAAILDHPLELVRITCVGKVKRQEPGSPMILGLVYFLQTPYL